MSGYSAQCQRCGTFVDSDRLNAAGNCPPCVSKAAMEAVDAAERMEQVQQTLERLP